MSLDTDFEGFSLKFLSQCRFYKDFSHIATRGVVKEAARRF